MEKVATLGRRIALGLLVAGLWAAAAGVASAQDPEEAERLPQARGEKLGIVYFETGWFGSVAGWTPRFAGLNELLEENGFAPLDRPALMGTGGGYVSVAGWKIGGMGGEGEAASKKGTNFAQLKTSLGAAHLARALRLGRTSLDFGVLLGGGRATLILSEGSPSTIEEAVDNRYDTVLDTDFLLGGPVVGLQYNLWGWLGLRLEAGHLYTLGWWTHAAGGGKVAGGPSLSGPYWAATVGFVLGGPIPVVPPIDRDKSDNVTLAY